MARDTIVFGADPVAVSESGQRSTIALSAALQETVTAGAPAITGILAAVESGADSAAIVGSATAAGTLAGIESGADSAAFAGGLIAAGTLNAAESGADDATGAGGVAITGTLVGPESATRDSAAINGAVGNAISGGLAAVESGVDAATGAGTVALTGTLAAVESGIDTAASAGAVAALAGIVAAIESGVDSAAGAGLSTIDGVLAAAERFSDRAAIAGQTRATANAPDLRTVLRAHMLADAAVAEMVGSRVSWGGRPRTAALPAVVLYMIDAERDYAMRTPTGLVRSRVQADCWAVTYGEAVSVSRAVRGSLSGLRTTIGGIEIQGVFADLERDLSDDDTGAAELLFRISQDYQVWHSEE
jgi:hypothetical protein